MTNIQKKKHLTEVHTMDTRVHPRAHTHTHTHTRTLGSFQRTKSQKDIYINTALSGSDRRSSLHQDIIIIITLYYYYC